MWTFRRPQAMFDYYNADDTSLVLAHPDDAVRECGGLPDHVLVPFRFGMDLDRIAEAIGRAEPYDSPDAVFAGFFLDRLEVTREGGERRILPVPSGIDCTMFLRGMDIAESARRLVFAHYPGANWDGIGKYSLVTVSVEENQWIQQWWNEPHFINDYLAKRFGHEVASGWGYAGAQLSLSASGDDLVVNSEYSSGEDGRVALKWVKGRWRIVREPMRRPCKLPLPRTLPSPLKSKSSKGPRAS